MKVVVQRVKAATVEIDGQTVAKIGHGLLTLFGVAKGDDEAKVAAAISKILSLRCFEDSLGKMNLSLKDVSGDHLIVSQFTLLGDCQRGTRPSFSQAEEPGRAERLYQEAIQLSEGQVRTQAGRFGANMQVSLVNDGPVTLVMEF